MKILGITIGGKETSVVEVTPTVPTDLVAELAFLEQQLESARIGDLEVDELSLIAKASLARTEEGCGIGPTETEFQIADIYLAFGHIIAGDRPGLLIERLRLIEGEVSLLFAKAELAAADVIDTFTDELVAEHHYINLEE